MDKKSTPSKFSVKSRDDMAGDNVSPSRMTIAMIRQFARAYHYDRRIDCRLGGIVVN